MRHRAGTVVTRRDRPGFFQKRSAAGTNEKGAKIAPFSFGEPQLE
jgi:hypothetical protein